MAYLRSKYTPVALSTAGDVTLTGSQTLTNKTITNPAGMDKNDVGLGNVDIASHDGTNGLKFGGTLVTATAANINAAASTGKAIAMAIVFGG